MATTLVTDILQNVWLCAHEQNPVHFNYIQLFDIHF